MRFTRTTPLQHRWKLLGWVRCDGRRCGIVICWVRGMVIIDWSTPRRAHRTRVR